MKHNQQKMYLNRGSNHTGTTFKSIPHRVFCIMAKLTTIDDNKKDQLLSEIYPAHFIRP